MEFSRRESSMRGCLTTTNLLDGEWEELDDSIEGDGGTTSFTDPELPIR